MGLLEVKLSFPHEIEEVVPLRKTTAIKRTGGEESAIGEMGEAEGREEDLEMKGPGWAVRRRGLGGVLD